MDIEFQQNQEGTYEPDNQLVLLNTDSRQQADDFAASEEREQYINASIQEIRNRMSNTDRVLIMDTMLQYSVEDSLAPIENQLNISQFNTHKQEGKTCGSTNVKKILERISIDKKNDSASDKRQSTIAVTWAAEFNGKRKLENIKQFSGFIAVKISNSSRFHDRWKLLKEDPFSCMLIANELGGKLTVIVKISANSVHEYELAYQHLADYYRNYYEVAEHELRSAQADICYLYDLQTGLDVYYNPLSRRLGRLFAGSLEQKVLNNKEFTLESEHTEDKRDYLLDQAETNPIVTEPSQQHKDDLYIDSLNTLWYIEQRILAAASQPIVFKPPLLSRLGVPIIGNGTINVIQGKQGQHKSRLAEMIVSLLVAKENCTTDFLGFERLVQSVMVCYLDTERNIDEECAHSLQSIRRNAGYDFNEEVTNLRFISLKQEERSKRMATIDLFLDKVRQSTNLPLFVVLDVVTDCIGSFNNDRDAMQLFDTIHRLCERHQSTFLLVIHENPTSEKARGHVGTEAGNKASTVLQISVEDSEATSPLIKLRYIKLRADKLPDPVYLQMDDQTKRLMLADETHIKTHVKSLKQKIDSEQLAETVLQLLADGPLPKGKLCKEVMEHFGAGDSLVRRKLTGLMTDQRPMIDQNGQQVVLAESGNGRDYFLQPID